MEKFEIGSATLYRGDCIEVMRAIPDGSVHSILTDPPYGLNDHKPAEVMTCLAAWLAGEPYAPKGRGFMGKRWDAWVPGPEVWRECLRILKPGGHLLAFAGTRSMDLMSMAVRLAGFELRDAVGYANDGGGAPLLAWTYGSGFPKSHNGDWGGTSLKPAWEPIILARKPLIGTVEANWREHSTGALNIDACRVPTDEKLGGGAEKATTPDQKGNEGWTRPWMEDEAAREAHAARVRSNVERAETLGRWPANLVHDGSDEVLTAFPQAAGQLAPISGAAPSEKTSNVYGRMHREGEASVARFFYCAKASKKDRGEANSHPTVKPTELMRYLCRLVTPPGGLVLDPFMGSGSTGKAAMLDGFRFVGIERDTDEKGQPLGYMDIARCRIERAQQAADIGEAMVVKAHSSHVAAHQIQPA